MASGRKGSIGYVLTVRTRAGATARFGGVRRLCRADAAGKSAGAGHAGLALQ